jgi:hypothetical protein
LGGNTAYALPSGQATTVTCKLDLGSGNALSSSGAGEAVITLGPGATVQGSATLNNVKIGNAQSTTEPVPALDSLPLWLLAFLVALGARARFRKHTQLPSRGH